MSKKYEIQFLDGRIEEYEGTLIDEDVYIGIGKYYIRKRDIMHIWKKELIKLRGTENGRRV